MNGKIEKEIRALVDDGVCSWTLVHFMKKCEREVRSSVVDKIIYGVLGAAFANPLITFIFRKEIAEMIDDVQNLSIRTLQKFVELLKRFKLTRRERLKGNKEVSK